MLIEFSVANFRSIKDLQTLSFVASPIDEHTDTHTFIATPKIRLLKSIGIYGANASGKSNVVKAMWAMLNFVKSSFEEKRKFREHIQPFMLNISTRDEGSFFQIVFKVEHKTYRYGFVYHKGKVISEWLFGTANKNEVMYFTREESDFDINKERFEEGEGLPQSKTREDNLFLNVVYEYNGLIASAIKQYLDNIITIQGNNKSYEENNLRYMNNDYLEDKRMKQKIVNLLKIADNEILDIELERDEVIRKDIQARFGLNIDALANEMEEQAFFSQIDISKLINIGQNATQDESYNPTVNLFKSKRYIYDSSGQNRGTTTMPFDEEASEGTKKMLNYAGVILKCIENGNVLVIDEFDSRFHTLLTQAIVKLFNSDKNQKGQICFVTHDTNLLDKNLLRRDQIYFTEKNKFGETVLYSLNDIKGVRNDASYEKDYIKGKYGAIPFLRNFNSILNNGKKN